MTGHRPFEGPPQTNLRNVPTSGGRAPLSGDRLPASGAWKPGDPAGDRKFHQFAIDRRFVLEGGGELRNVVAAYESWGTPRLDDDGHVANAVLICHALTGDSHAAGRTGPGHPAPGWWVDVIGPGRAFNTDDHFVVCVNVLGGCQGSTGPASIDATTGVPYGPTFPVVTIRDMVRAQAAVADHLGVAAWQAVVGGSMGGMQVLEWAVMYPARVRSFIAIATCAAATAQQIAFSSVQRSTVALDPGWRNGWYYDAEPGEGPHQGLAIARELAQVTYRSEQVFAERFGRRLIAPSDRLDLWQRFEVEGYLDYHGAKLCRRFDANSYLTIAKAMDLHDLSRGRGGMARALDRITAPGLTVSINTDGLYPPYQQHQVRDGLRRLGKVCAHAEIDSPHGHDSFLLEHEQVARIVQDFFALLNASPGDLS